MLKKTIAFILSLMFVFSALGVVTLFSGVLTAGAVYYDYYNYISLPGWGDFTEQDLTELHNPGLELSQVDAPDFAPERVTKATKIVVNDSRPVDYQGATGYEGIVTLASFVALNLGEINPDNNPINIQWCAKKSPSSDVSFAGGRDFSDDTGFCFWIGHNEGREYGGVKINIFCLPYAGPTGYYTGDDPKMEDAMNGFVFEAKKTPDEDGYVYFDFKTDFVQVDWFWKFDDGKNYSILSHENIKRPLPYNALPYINAITITLGSASVGDSYYIGDFCAYQDSRIHTDELAEAIEIFDNLDSEAYTEESYADATEVYLRAYEMLLDDSISEHYTQREVDSMAKELINAVNALMPLFPARMPIQLNGFGTWSEEDLETISDGGISLDPAIFAEEGVGPEDPTIEIVANGDSTFAEPYYGWSCFKSTIDNDGEEAVGNPFGADLTESAGLRFWLKNPDGITPSAMQILVGKAGEAEFVAEDYDISRPMTEGGSGYVHVSWNSFYELSDTDSDIFDYLDQLDYIAIQFEDLRQTSYYISDLHVFEWSLQNADLTELKRVLNDAILYVAGLNEADYTPRTWSNLQQAIASAQLLLDKYGVNQDEVDEATAEITKRVNRLALIGDGAPLDKLNYLYALINCGRNYWRGNYVSATYNALNVVLEEAEEAIDDTITSEYCDALNARIEAAIANLVPITHGSSIEKGFFSFESYTGRDLSKASGDRTKDVRYTLIKKKDAPILPDGYDQALLMESLVDMSSGEGDEHGVLQFKSIYRNGAGSPVFIEPSTGDPLVGDLTGSDGFLVWIGVNDVNLVSDGKFRVGVSNCDIGPLFEMHAIDIPLPPTGSGWIYIPWNYFDHYDEWTHGEPIRLNEIRFYIFRFDGQVQQGLQVYITGLQAYKETKTTSNVQPYVSNIADGATIDVSEGALVPDWNAGGAILDGKYFTYGSSINTNGDHTLKLINGDKTTVLNFTVTGGVSEDEVPVISGVVNGGEYDAPVAPTWTPAEATAALNGEEYTAGTEITEPGEYTLVVTNGDKSATVAFTIKEQTPPPPQHKKGDMDGDNEITVADALKALRIAAKLVRPTEDDIAIGDVDGDGEITVADALKILRVAAKLADEDSLA